MFGHPEIKVNPLPEIKYWKLIYSNKTVNAELLAKNCDKIVQFYNYALFHVKKQ